MPKHVEEWAQVVRELIRLEAGATCSPWRIRSELDLALVCVEVEEELVHLVHDLVDSRIWAVDLVDHEDQRSLASNALRNTKRVCGSGPSASTSSRTPSTIVSARSTSPPKSACPGVSTMLILNPP